MPPPTVREVIERRRTPRQFDPDRAISGDLLAEILRLAAHAPSPFNLQPWRFLVLRSSRNRERLRACAFGRREVAEAPIALIVLGYLRPHHTDLEAMIELRNRLGILAPEEAVELRARVPRTIDRVADPSAWASRWAMMAAATLMIAAESLGVASAALDRFDEGGIRDAFGVPDDHAVALILALGFAAKEERSPGRFDLDRSCFSEHFGRPWTPGPALDPAGSPVYDGPTAENPRRTP